MYTIPLLNWDVVHVGALAWSDDGKPLPCDVPRGIVLRAEPATKTQPILVPDRPWEGPFSWAQVMEHEGGYRLWYGIRREPRNPREVVCLAESDDGLTWRKPELGIIELDGSKANNAVFAGPGSLHFCITRCPHEVPGKRYRCLTFKSWWEGEPGQELDNEEGHRRLDLKNAAKPGDQVLPVSLKGAMKGMNSPDGLHWTEIPGTVLDEWHDTHNICVYDERTRRYRAYLRGFHAGRRAISYTETETFELWPSSRVIHGPDNADRPDESLYSNTYTRYPGRSDLHLMFPAVYDQGSDTTYRQLAVSRDGIHWSRFSGQASIPHGNPGDPDEGMVYPEPDLLRFPREAKFRLLCHLGNRYHNMWYNAKLRDQKEGSYYAWAEWPEDRLAGIYSADDGEFTTGMHTCGDRMLANYRTEPGGWIRFELVERLVWPPVPWHGIKEFRFEDSAVLTGDQTHAPVSWNGNADLSRMAGKPVGIRVRMHKAILFALTFYGVKDPLVQEDPRFPV